MDADKINAIINNDFYLYLRKLYNVNDYGSDATNAAVFDVSFVSYLIATKNHANLRTLRVLKPSEDKLATVIHILFFLYAENNQCFFFFFLNLFFISKSLQKYKTQIFGTLNSKRYVEKYEQIKKEIPVACNEELNKWYTLTD